VTSERERGEAPGHGGGADRDPGRAAWPPGTGRRSVARLPDQWFPVCFARSLGARPLPVRLQGVPLVLFRDARGGPVALLDRCPHRNVPLSLGRCREGTLACAYHGWRFDGAGACREVPGLVEADAAGAPGRAVPSFPACESDGLVWVWSTPGPAPQAGPFRFPHLTDARYALAWQAARLRGTVLAAVENALDVPHTRFLHGGLFRTASREREVEVAVRRSADRVEAEYLGEPRPEGLLAALLAPGGGTVQHVDRFVLPCLAQVEYRLGERSHLVATTAFTPEADDSVRLFSCVAFRLPVPGWLARPLLAPLARHVLDQDARMLAAQADAIDRFGGEAPAHTELDVLGPHVWHLLRRAERGEPGEPFEPQRRRMRT
jgi:phenylpropionate dioxygenase-like ring-hydroxylating dioxygenase large terminal subunit